RMARSVQRAHELGTDLPARVRFVMTEADQCRHSPQARQQLELGPPASRRLDGHADAAAHVDRLPERMLDERPVFAPYVRGGGGRVPDQLQRPRAWIFAVALRAQQCGDRLRRALVPNPQVARRGQPPSIIGAALAGEARLAY